MKKFSSTLKILILSSAILGCTVQQIVPPDFEVPIKPELPSVSLREENEMYCTDIQGLKDLYKREMLLLNHIDLLEYQIQLINEE